MRGQSPHGIRVIARVHGHSQHGTRPWLHHDDRPALRAGLHHRRFQLQLSDVLDDVVDRQGHIVPAARRPRSGPPLENRSSQGITLQFQDLLLPAQKGVVAQLQAFQPLIVHTREAQHMGQHGTLGVIPASLHENANPVPRETPERRALLGIHLSRNPDKVPLP